MAKFSYTDHKTTKSDESIDFFGIKVYCYSVLYLRVNSPNTGGLLNIGNGPQSGPPLYSKAEGRFAALNFIMGRSAAERPISF